MPVYEVEHVCALSPGQQDELAEAITRLHSDHFQTPRLFVNVRFTNIEHHATYVAGKRRKTNKITALVRNGPSRTPDHWNVLSAEMIKAWDTVVNHPHTANGNGTTGETELRLIVFLGAIVSATEVGFAIPPAGGDKQWLKENLGKFQQKADEGDDDFAEMIQEVKDRGLI